MKTMFWVCGGIIALFSILSLLSLWLTVKKEKPGTGALAPESNRGRIKSLWERNGRQAGWRMVVTVAIGTIITLTLREFWRQEWDWFFSQHGWYAWLALIAGNFLFCLLFGRENKTGSGSSASAEGSGSGKSLLGLLATLFVLGMITSIFMLGREQYASGTGQHRAQNSGGVILLPAPPLPQTQRYVLEVPPDRETRIPIPMGMTCDTDPLPDPAHVNATPAVWVRLEGQKPFKDWTGRPSGGTKKLWSDYKYLRSAEKYPVRVQVLIRPSE